MKRGNIHTFVLDPAPVNMTPAAKRELPVLLNGVTAFLPSKEELRDIFWGETHDLWEMAEAVSLYGCEYRRDQMRSTRANALRGWLQTQI